MSQQQLGASKPRRGWVPAAPVEHLGVSSAFSPPLQNYIESLLHGRNGLRWTTSSNVPQPKQPVLNPTNKIRRRTSRRETLPTRRTSADLRTRNETPPHVKAMNYHWASSEGMGRDDTFVGPERRMHYRPPPGLLTPVGPDWWKSFDVLSAVAASNPLETGKENKTEMSNSTAGLVSTASDVYQPSNDEMTMVLSRDRERRQSDFEEETCATTDGGIRDSNDGGDDSREYQRERYATGDPHKHDGGRISVFSKTVPRRRRSPRLSSSVFQDSPSAQSDNYFEDTTSRDERNDKKHGGTSGGQRLRHRPSSAQPFSATRQNYDQFVGSGKRPTYGQHRRTPRGAWDAFTGRKMKLGNTAKGSRFFDGRSVGSRGSTR